MLTAPSRRFLAEEEDWGAGAVACSLAGCDLGRPGGFQASGLRPELTPDATEELT